MPRYDSDNLFWESPYSGILKASGEVKNYGVEVDNYFFDQFDPESYLQQFEALMDANPTAVVIVPTFSKETKLITDRLEKSKIPYIFFNIDLEGFNNISFRAGFLYGRLCGR